MKNVILVPTSHVAEESVRKAREIISREEPDCVAVELDLGRLMALEQGEASHMEALKRLGPWTFAMLWVMKALQSWLGRKAGILPGSDMLGAVKAAEYRGVQVELIDQDIGLTMEGLRRVHWREKAKLLFFILKGATIDSLVSLSGKGERLSIDLSSVPPKELVSDVLSILRKEFPQIYRALVRDRDLYMARRIAALTQSHDRIIVFVGAAHVSGIQALLCGKAR